MITETPIGVHRKYSLNVAIFAIFFVFFTTNLVYLGPKTAFFTTYSVFYVFVGFE